ncbi:hypothetical protein [Zhongshania sp.]|uniref:hypothetical protein n=1 Tax=Zhongshania sp. TaxID=1971902 RepID=UPI00356A91B2
MKICKIQWLWLIAWGLLTGCVSIQEAIETCVDAGRHTIITATTHQGLMVAVTGVECVDKEEK